MKTEPKIKSKKKKIQEFLNANGWKLGNKEDEYLTYDKDGCLSIDISDKEMVFLDDSGDFHHADTNLYTLIGVLICYRQLPLNFKQP